jgi:hypothetical protein
MRITDVPSPGGVSNAFALRREMIRALSTAQVQSRVSPTSKTAETLAAFLRACADTAEGLRPAAPAAPKPKKTPTSKGTTE